MTSCQVSGNPKTGPVIAQTRTTPTANTKVEGRPVCLAVPTASPHPGRRRVFTGGYTSDIGKATARLHPMLAQEGGRRRHSDDRQRRVWVKIWGDNFAPRTVWRM